VKIICIACFFSLFVILSLQADQEAVTVDGQTVILKADGTWVYQQRPAKAKLPTATGTADLATLHPKLDLSESVTQKTDFRLSRWGMDKVQVQKLETAKISKNTDKYLGFQESFLNKKVYILYSFKASKLYQGAYILLEDHANKNKYITEFEIFKDYLTQRYGDPKKKNIVWIDDEHKNNPDKKGACQ